MPGCHFYKADITDKESISKILDEHPDIDFVIHNAMVSAVAKSVNHPYDFYYQNVVTSMELFHLLKNRGIKKYYICFNGFYMMMHLAMLLQKGHH